MRNLLPLLGCFALLAACALTPKDVGKAYMFALPPAAAQAHKHSASSLTVALPTAAPELDTYRIALSRDGKRWDYYAGARWADFLPVMVQDSLAKTLSDARLFKTAAADLSGARGDLTLNTDIRAFQAEYGKNGAAPVVKIQLMFRLRQDAAAAFDIKAEARAKQDSLPAIQAAFAEAFIEAQKQLVSRISRRL